MNRKSGKYEKKISKLKKRYEKKKEFYRLIAILCLATSIQCRCTGILPCSERELIRGALLHDYFLYDWHDRSRENYQALHGFYHPGIALKNASKEYKLTLREKDIIKKHMWPLTIVPPRCREAWIVTTADKYCSILETLKLRRGVGKARLRISG